MSKGKTLHRIGKALQRTIIGKQSKGIKGMKVQRDASASSA
jgi:hypothetical protein